MGRSFFPYMDQAAAMILKKYPNLTRAFENCADASVELLGYDFGVPKPSELMVQFLYRSNMNYLIGAYKALIQTIPSFAYSGMRNGFEGILRGYYYQSFEDAACASYLYMVTHGEPGGPGLDDQDVAIMKEIIDSVQDEKLKKLCEKVIKKETFSEDEKKAISEHDKPSREVKHTIGKLYTKSVQNDMKGIWRELSRFSHAGVRGRYRDLHLEGKAIDGYEKDLRSLLLLLAANNIMYLEVIDPKGMDLSSLVRVLATIKAFPKYTPNKQDLPDLFKFSTPEAFDDMLRVV